MATLPANDTLIVRRFGPMRRFVRFWRTYFLHRSLVRGYCGYEWRTILKPRYPLLPLPRAEAPTEHAPWLNDQAIAYRRAIGRKEPFLG